MKEELQDQRNADELGDGNQRLKHNQFSLPPSLLWALICAASFSFTAGRLSPHYGNMAIGHLLT